MKNQFLAIFLVVVSLISCAAPMEENTEIWWINSAKVDCVGMGPMTCMQIQSNETIDPDAWTLFYDGIQGFEYEPGFIYQLKVRILDREAPIPQDASSKIYELVEIISKEVDPSLRLTNIWKVIAVGDLDNPTKADSEDPLIFEFNASAKTYFGDMGCNTVRGSIKSNDGSALTLGPGAATMMACITMETENLVSNALKNVTRYEIADRQLHFFDPNGQKLISFQAVD